MHPLRKKRLQHIVFLVLGVSSAVGLLAYSLRQDINLFITPSQVAKGEVQLGKTVRLGGLVVSGSVQRSQSDLRVSFKLTDGLFEVLVFYDGILPDLFREGQGVVALGKIDANLTMQADQVLAKHDEKYTPPEVKNALEKAHQTGVKTLESARD